MGITYCDIAPGHEWHGPYHDTEYGVPIADEAALFERLGAMSVHLVDARPQRAAPEVR